MVPDTDSTNEWIEYYSKNQKVVKTRSPMMKSRSPALNTMGFLTFNPMSEPERKFTVPWQSVLFF